jgi:light-regulated signal transduction histidine kinase (bacteriophytochrome)
MVSSFLSLLEKRIDDRLTDTTREYMNFAVDGAKRMKLLISDLLHYSRVGTNKEQFTTIDLNEMLVYITQLLKEDIDKNQAVITIHPLPVMTANKTLINELFVNLLSNALKYRSEKDPVIDIGYTEESDYYNFYVKDNGLGIEADYFDKIFVIFQRLHGKTEYPGTGIGLALCRKIVETHKGKIWVESKLGEGSCFCFSIPKVISI